MLQGQGDLDFPKHTHAHAHTRTHKMYTYHFSMKTAQNSLTLREKQYTESLFSLCHSGTTHSL